MINYSHGITALIIVNPLRWIHPSEAGTSTTTILTPQNPEGPSQWNVKRAWLATNAMVINSDARRSPRDASVATVGET